MLHSAEGPGHLTDGIIRSKPFHQSNGSHVVFNVVGAGDQNILGFQQLLPPAVNNAIFLPNAVGPLRSGEEPGLPVACEGGGNGIVGVQHQDTGFVLIFENILLGIHIFFHVLVDIQVVGGQVGDQRPLRTALHVHKLEGAEFHHSEVLFAHLAAQGQQRCADVAPQPYPFAGGLQHLGNQGGGCCLPVRARHTDDLARADLKEYLHLRGHLSPPGTQGLDRGVSRVHTGGPEENIRLHTVQVSFSHPELTAPIFQLQHLGIQLLPRGPVAARHIAAVFQQQLYQRPIADPKPKHRYFFTLQRGKIRFKRVHMYRLPYISR